MMSPPKKRPRALQGRLERERFEVLEQLERWLEAPMVVLGFAWLALLILDLTQGLTPFFDRLNLLIWGVFILDFLLKFILAPRKRTYLVHNWLTLLSLALPALRVLRLFRLLPILRAGRAVRLLRLVRLFGSLNRGMRSLSASMQRRGLGYLLLLTVIVAFLGAAGMYGFEQNPGGAGLNDYGTALWWTLMVLTTMGSEFWPRTPEGRMLCLLLATYAFTVWGYLTAAFASFFIGRDRQKAAASKEEAADRKELQREIARLRADVEQLLQQRTQ